MEGLIRPASEEITRPVSEEIIIPNYVKTILNKDFNIKKGLNLKEKFKIDNKEIDNKTPPITIEEADTEHILSINPNNIGNNTLGDDDKLIQKINTLLCKNNIEETDLEDININIENITRIVRIALVLAHNHDISKREYDQDISYTYGVRCITYLLYTYNNIDPSIISSEEFFQLIVNQCIHVYGEHLANHVLSQVQLPRFKIVFDRVFEDITKSINQPKSIGVTTGGKRNTKNQQQSTQQSSQRKNH